MNVLSELDGRFTVTDDSGAVIAGPFESNREAWRWIDRHDGEPTSRAEQTSD